MANILKINLHTVAGQNCNEDAIALGDNYLFVIDGATGLSKTHITNELSDARWFSSQLKLRLEQAFTSKNKDDDIYVLLHNIINDLNDEYLSLANQKGIGIPPDFPSAGIALFRIINDETLEFYGLGDCVGVLFKENGDAFTSCDTNLPALDDISIATMVKASKKYNISVLEARPYALDVIKENRNKRNTEKGYWILDLSGKGINHARHEFFNISEVKELFVCSDGFAQLVSPFNKFESYETLAKYSLTHDVKDMVKDLFNYQEQDKGANNYPRLKFRDDTTVGVAIINK